MSEEERTARLAELERKEREFSRLRRQKTSVDDFEPLTIIGRGAFGEARLPVRSRLRCCCCRVSDPARCRRNNRCGWSVSTRPARCTP